MVNNIISKQVGYLAPSVYGLGSNRALAAHDLLESEFIKALVNYGSGTVGDKLKAAYWNYRSGYNYTHDDVSVYAAYGTIYYGLPTQKIVSTVEELAALQEATQVQELQANQVDDDFKLAKINKKTSLNINTGSTSHSMNLR